MRKITFRSIYDVNFRKFNVTSEGVSIERDAKGNRYITGSADNVKKCVLTLIAQNGGYNTLERVFEKKIDKKKGIKDKIEQGGVRTKIDLYNPMTTFGAWDSNGSDEEVKYKGVAIKSSVNFGYFKPLANELCTITNQVRTNGTIKGAEGVCVGCDNDSMEFSCGNDKYSTPEELSNAGFGTIEECVAAFNNERKMNLYEKSPLANGLFVLECEIDMDAFGRYRLYDIKRNEEQCKEFIDKGWKIVTINGSQYIEMPADDRKRLFENLVKALYEFEFMSNNSAAGNPLVLTRTSFGYQNANKVVQSMEYDAHTKEFSISDHINGVQSFNMPHLRQWVDVKANDLTVDFNAIDNATEKLIELGNSIIGE